MATHEFDPAKTSRRRRVDSNRRVSKPLSASGDAKSPQPQSSDHDEKAKASRVAAVGRHLLADFHGVESYRLTSESTLVELFISSCIGAGCQVLSHTSQKFPGEDAGVTGLILLAESHAAFHTYPELNYMAVDVFVCGNVHPEDVIAPIVAALQPDRVKQKIELRG